VVILHVDQLGDFLGMPREDRGAGYRAMAAALRRVLEGVERAVRQLSPEQMEAPTPNRGRDIRELVFNIHDPIRSMGDSLDSGLFQWATEEDHQRSRGFSTPGELADFCRGIREGWWNRAARVDAEEADLMVETPRGVVTHLQLLESQAWHAAQHLRQIYDFLRGIGIEPEGELGAEDIRPIQLGEIVY